MEILRRSWTQILAWLEGLNRAEKALIVCLLVIILGVLAYLVSWAGQPEIVPIGQFVGGRAEEVQARLVSSGIDARVENGQIYVPIAQQNEAIAILVQRDLLSDDPSSAFDDLIRTQSPWTTDKQGERAYLVAKQKVLGSIVSSMAGIRRGNVIISLPQQHGFGVTHTTPSASVTVQMQSGRMNQQMAESIAGLVASAVAEMSPQDVAVIDAGTGKQFKAGDEDDILPTERLEIVRWIEDKARQKIERSLSYIDGVIVAVNVQTDTIRRHQEEQFRYSETEPIQSERILEESSRTLARQGEPGVRPNTGMDINAAGGDMTEQSRSETENTFGEKQLVNRSQIVHTGLNTQRINVSVNVPRRYFVALWKGANPPAAGQQATEPSDADLDPIVQQELLKIEAQIEPLIAAESAGVIAAHMIPDDTLLPMTPGVGAVSTVDSIMGSGWVGPVGVTLLAMLSLALMLGMVKKATQPESLPSVEELAGVPPTLPDDEELIGEVEETEHSLEGVELDPDELKSRRIAEQISEMIKSNPTEAGSILGKWVGTED